MHSKHETLERKMKMKKMKNGKGDFLVLRIKNHHAR